MFSRLIIFPFSLFLFLTFIKSCKYKGNYCRRSLDVIRSILSKNKVCLLDVQSCVSDTNSSSVSHSFSPSLYCTLRLFGTYLSQKPISLFLSSPKGLVCLLSYQSGLLKKSFSGEQLPLISSIWRFPLWLMWLGWWQSEPAQMASLMRSPNKALSMIPVKLKLWTHIVQSLPQQTFSVCFCSVDNDTHAQIRHYIL